jgi:D-alanyl-D-alanine carboxypeptidase (penicillin-binding protein 5/6)
MNRTAARLGLAHTHYHSPYGLDAPGAYSTAADQLILARALMRDPRIQAIVRKRYATVNGRRLPASNTLLGVYRGIDGVKTGHTNQAGWCLAATAHRDGQRLYVVGLGAVDEASRNEGVEDLLDWGFRQLHPVAVVTRGQAAGLVGVDTGGTLPVVVAAPVTVTLRPGDRLSLSYELPSRVTAPVALGTAEGRVVVLRNGVPEGSAPIVSAEAVAVPGILHRIRSVFSSLLGSVLPI